MPCSWWPRTVCQDAGRMLWAAKNELEVHATILGAKEVGVYALSGPWRLLLTDFFLIR